MNEQSVTIEQIEAMLAAQAEPVPAPFPGDPTATWDYWSGLDNPTDGPTDAVVWARLRYRRDQLLAACDFRVLPDNPSDQVAWKAYRKALRDLPKNTVDPRKAVWPVAP